MASDGKAYIFRPDTYEILSFEIIVDPPTQRKAVLLENILRVQKSVKMLFGGNIDIFMFWKW